MNIQQRTLLEAKKKIPVVGAFINIVIPGAAHMYCENFGKGVIYFVVCVIISIIVAISTFGLGLFIVAIFVFIDGYTAVTKFNKKITDEMLAEDQISTPVQEKLKTCEKCAENVKVAAKVCRFCGFEFPEKKDERPRIGYKPTDFMPKEDKIASL